MDSKLSQREHLQQLGLALILTFLTTRATAFSLLGPYTGWMAETNGFRQRGDIGGPMNHGEEYRWNVPVATYTFDESFLDYFGSNGVAAVESAIGILNSLPSASQINPSNYPAEVTWINYLAQSQGLIDLESETLFQLVQQLGLAQPTRFAFCLQSFSITNNIITGIVVQRNFDPSSIGYSTNVNDTSYGYDLWYQSTGQGTMADAVEFPIDPLSDTFTAVADGALAPGAFYTGLTRDDAGGLRYLLTTNNINYETLLSGVHGTGANAGSFVNGALRHGVDKITFVRVNGYDPIIGQFFIPFTNQFTDSFISNGVPAHQQLERVITRPDFLFSAADVNDGDPPVPLVVSTSTSNWLASSALPGLAGPGIIQPQVKIAFMKPAFRIQTSDAWPAGTAHVENFHWGSFDGSTNLPVVYPDGTPLGNTHQLTLHFRLLGPNAAPSQSFTWQLPVSLGQSVRVQTSTNLVDWVSLTLVANCGMDVNWQHTCSRPQGFFRIVPQ
jgi:hypothetical protein